MAEESQTISDQTIAASAVFSNISLESKQEIQNTIDESNSADDYIRDSITNREKKLSENFLSVDDTNTKKIRTRGFRIENVNLTSGHGGDSDIQTLGIQTGGFLIHGADGRTRFFSAEGKQFFYADDAESEKIISPNGGKIPATYSLSVPSGSIINCVGNNYHIE